MIVAVSRFRVANGLDQAVVTAFADRPRLADEWPGLLGMETVADTQDATVNHLVTRWTDQEAFRTWHGSRAHRESHEWMPEGLRLDPSSTQLVRWERLATPGAPDIATVVAADAVAAMSGYLEQTRVVHVVRLALTGQIEMMNSAMVSHLGLVQAPLGRSLFEFLTATDADAVRCRLNSRENSPHPVNLNYCDGHGDPFTLSSHLTIYSDGCLVLGEPAYAHEQQLQRQLVELNEELAALVRQRQRTVATEQRARRDAESDNRDKDEGLAMIAHELRQPLSTAMTALQVLKRSPDDADRALRMLDSQLSSMATLVEDLLHASQVMRGAVLVQEPADLARLVRDAAESIEPEMRARGQQLAIDDGRTPLRVSVDINRMRQVLMNILSNAVKYTPAGGSIEISVEGIGETACIRVRDTGEGIPAEVIGRVFDLFVRGTTGGNGMGIGLAVAKRLVEQHGGRLAVRSEGPGRGSEFTVTLPVLTRAPADFPAT